MKKLLVFLLVIFCASIVSAETVKFTWDAAYNYHVFLAYDEEPFDYSDPVWIGPDLQTDEIEIEEDRTVRVTARTVLDDEHSVDAEVYIFTVSVLDDGDDGTSSTGDWTVSNAGGSYGDQSLYTREAEAAYSFLSDASGQCEIALWWTEYSSRSPLVPIDIYDGESLLETLYVDQQSNGGKWNSIGTFTFAGHPKVVVRASDPTSGSYTTCADACKFIYEQ